MRFNWTSFGVILCVQLAALCTRVSSCGFLDQLAVAATAGELLTCLDISTADLSAIQNEIAALLSLPALDMIDEVNTCLALTCPDGEEACPARVTCLNDALLDLDDYLVVNGLTLSSQLLSVVSKFCGCYTILEEIPEDCYDYVDGILGFHLPIDVIEAKAAEYCPRLDEGCVYLGGFYDDCLDADATSTELAAACSAYANALIPGALAARDDDTYAVGDDAAAQQAYMLCAAEAASIALLPAGAITVLESTCSTDAVSAETWTELESMRSACAGAFDDVVGVIWPTPSPSLMPTPPPNATAAPTPLPTMAGTVTVAIAMKFASGAPYSEGGSAALKSAVAAAAGVAETSIRSFTVVATTLTSSASAGAAAAAGEGTTFSEAAAAETITTTKKAAAPLRGSLVRSSLRRRLEGTTYEWSVTLDVVAVPSTVGASDGPSFAALLADDLNSDTFATSAGDALNTTVTLDASEGVIAEVAYTRAPSPRPTSSPTHPVPTPQPTLKPLLPPTPPPTPLPTPLPQPPSDQAGATVTSFILLFCTLAVLAFAAYWRSKHAAKEDVLEDFPPSDDEFANAEGASPAGFGGDIELRASSSSRNSDSNNGGIPTYSLKASPAGTATLPPMSSPAKKSSNNSSYKGNFSGNKKPKEARSVYSTLVNPLSGAAAMDESEGEGESDESNFLRAPSSDRSDSPSGRECASPGMSLDRPPQNHPSQKEGNSNQPPSMWL